MKAMLSKASRLGDRTLKAGPTEQRRFFLDVVIRIKVRQDRVRIILHTDALRGTLGKVQAVDANEENGTQGKGEFNLDIPVNFKRRGVETKLVVTGDQGPVPAPDPKLIAAVARGHGWFSELRNGEARSVGGLVERHGVDQGDVSRLIPLAFLVPDIVEAILDGRQPVQLTAARLKRVRDLPVSWVDQRRLLDFTR